MMYVKYGIVVWLSLLSSLLAASVPQIIELNGTLAWENSSESVAGVQPFTVRIYDQLTDGTLLWEEHYNVEVDPDGRYGIQLGSGTQGAATNSLTDALALAGGAAFVEQDVRINGEVRLFAPRQPLAVAPFALMAGNAFRATQGFSVHEALTVGGITEARALQALTLTNSNSVVSNQLYLTGGTLKCDTLTAQNSDEPVVFSTGISATKDIHVQGGASIFSMRKPQLTEKIIYHRFRYTVDTDCWLFLRPSPLAVDWKVINVWVGTLYTHTEYNFRMESEYPIPIPKGFSIEVQYNYGEYDVKYLKLNTDPTNPAVFADGEFPASFFMCLGVKP